MKNACVSALLIWLACLSIQHALGQEASTSQPAASSPAPRDQLAAEDAPLQVPVKGSQIPHEENRCAACHTEAALWEGDKLKLFVSPEVLAHDVHWTKGVAPL